MRMTLVEARRRAGYSAGAYVTDFDERPQRRIVLHHEHARRRRTGGCGSCRGSVG